MNARVQSAVEYIVRPQPSQLPGQPSLWINRVLSSTEAAFFGSAQLMGQDCTLANHQAFKRIILFYNGGALRVEQVTRIAQFLIAEY
jgi:hypothetical protein